MTSLAKLVRGLTRIFGGLKLELKRLIWLKRRKAKRGVSVNRKKLERKEWESGSLFLIFSLNGKKGLGRFISPWWKNSERSEC